MRILWILPFVPWPIKVRSFNLIPRLARRHDIDLVCVARSPADFARLEMIRQACSSVRTGNYSTMGALANCLRTLPTRMPLRIAYVSSNSMRRAVAEAIARNHPNVIYVERWRALQYVPDDVEVPVICDPTDSMGLYNRRLMTAGLPWQRVLGLVEYLKFRRFEPRMAGRVAATVFCSRTDLEFVGRSAPGANLVQVPNGVDCELFHFKTPGDEQPGGIFFSGNFLYAPNRDAVRFFLKEVFPQVRRAVPEATLTIAGNGARKFAERDLFSISEGQFQRFDFAPELRPHLARASVAIAPIRIGAGVSNKLLEAFAVGTPIVSTRMACGDLPCRDGEHLFLADDAVLFAERIVLLLRSPELRRAMAAKAQTFVRANYDWEIVARTLEEVLQRAAFRESDLQSPTLEATSNARAMAAAAD